MAVLAGGRAGRWPCWPCWPVAVLAVLAVLADIHLAVLAGHRASSVLQRSISKRLLTWGLLVSAY